MSEALSPPPFWRDLEAAVAAYLQTPLFVDGSPPTLRSPAPPPSLLAAVVDDGPGVVARLTLYHQQQWQRRLLTLQQTWPTTLSLLGAWTFNRVALPFVEAQWRGEGGRVHDLGALSVGFYEHGAALIGASVDDDGPVAALGDVALVNRLPRSALLQALARDEALRRAFAAPHLPTTPVDDRQRGAVLRGRLHLAPGLSVLRSTWQWPTATLLLTGQPHPVHHVVFRAATGVDVVEVDAITARALGLCTRHPWPEVVARVTAALPPAQQPHSAVLLDNVVALALQQGWLSPLGVLPTAMNE